MVYLNRLSTLHILLLGLLFSVLANVPFYAFIFNKHWFLIAGFPFSWLSVGMNYMATFFHELGHTVFMWFYGYPTIPVFDFAHGGGMAVALTDQQIPLLLLVWGGLGYGLWFFRQYRSFQILITFLVILNLSLVFSHDRAAVMDFMGPAAECLVGGFLLYRALFNLAPRGDFERFLNAFFGFGMIFQVFVNGYGLLHSTAFRLVYYQQKGSHGFGDFHKIADRLPFWDFSDVVSIWLGLNLICLIVPFVLFFLISPVVEADEE